MISYTLQQIKMDLEHTMDHLETKVLQQLRTPKEELIGLRIIKKSWDARKKQDIKVVYGVEAQVQQPIKPFLVDGVNISLTKEEKYSFPQSSKVLAKRPIIVGSGPAGLFCALMLAESGHKPLVLERGADVDRRDKDIDIYFRTGKLNPQSNIQFGEGGAGTYSDGKLNTQVKDPMLRKEKVLTEFIEAGAPAEIGYLSKPHIGTDYLITVVKNMRRKIEALGGEVRFDAQVTRLLLEADRVVGVEINGSETIPADQVVMAIGHSARDTFKMLCDLGIPMEQKAFAIGLRIEHPQSMISESQFGKSWQHPNLPVADYKLTHRTSKGRGVYSFCMCPGGHVVNASSEEGGVACNGMSYFRRNSSTANSAIIVNVTPEDFGSADILAGVAFQRKWEQAAYEIAGSNQNLPVQLFKDFVAGKTSRGFEGVVPNIKGATTFADLNKCLPHDVAEGIKEGVLEFEKKIRGFSRGDAVLTGVETRTSSPVRILRDDELESPIKGLYPCGEGAGYAGGIMSAAMDGIKVAEKIVI